MKFLNKRNKLIAFVGPDGCGKTSFINSFSSQLDPDIKIIKFHIRFHTVPRIGQLINRIKNLFGSSTSISMSATSSSLDDQYQKYHYPPPKHIFVCILVLLYECIDYASGYFYSFFSRRQTFFIFDRYLYDYYTELDWINTPHWFIRIVMFIAPTPNHIVHLTNSAEAIFSRKGELSIEEINMINYRIEHLLASHTSYTTIVTDKPADDLAFEFITNKLYV